MDRHSIQPYLEAFEVEPFQPVKGLSEGNQQSLLGYFTKQQRGVSFRRERIETPDDDFFLIDFAEVPWATWEHLGNEAPIVLVLHGLEGSTKSGYMYETYKQLASRGIRAIGMNHRSCGGELNRQISTYNAATTHDVDYLCRHIAERFPHVPLGIVGYSLSGSMVVHYLAKQAKELPATLQAAAIVSPPFDLASASDVMDKWSRRIYTRRFVQSRQAKIRQKRHLLRDKVNVDKVLSAKTLGQMDAILAPLHGYYSEIDYYNRASAGPYVEHIQTPTIILRAKDDPFFANDIPYDVLEDNPYLVDGVTNKGGHLGFVAGSAWRPDFWVERQVARFFEYVFKWKKP